MPRCRLPPRKLSGSEDFGGLERATPSLPAGWYFDAQRYGAELVFDWLFAPATPAHGLPIPEEYHVIGFRDCSRMQIGDRD